MTLHSLQQPRSAHVRVSPNEEGLDRVAGAYFAFAARYAIPDDVRTDMYVALEEIVSNVVRHGEGAERVDVTFTVTRDLLRVDVVDDGPRFDPFSAPAPDLTQSIDERPIGGLGVLLTRELADSSYARHDHTNHVTLQRSFRL